MAVRPTRKQTSTTPRRSPRGVTRRDVLDVSLTLFAENGYRKTSLEHVAAKLGVTRQALYYHFRSKDEILGALFDETMTKLESAVAKAKEANDGEGSAFLDLLRAHIQATVDNPQLVALLLHERPEIAQLKGLKATKRRREYSQSFVESYEAGKASGTFDPSVDAWVAVNTLLAAANGISWWYHGDGSSSAETIGDDVFRLLTMGCVLPAATTAAKPRRRAVRS